MSLSIEAAPDGQPEAAAAPAPAAPSERIEIIDVVRGIALFGVLAANMRGFAGPFTAYLTPQLLWTAPADRAAQAFIDTFVQGKFIAIFAVLFGVGFASQLSRAEARGSGFGWTYARRLFLLCLFGLAHGLFIWPGDILFEYGLTGFLLFFFRNANDRTVWRWATIGYAFPLALTAVAVVMGGVGTPAPRATPAQLQRTVEIFARGSWREIQQQRAGEVMALNWGMLQVSFLPILGLFLFGILAWRRRFFTPSPESLSRYRAVMIGALGVGTLLSLAATMVRWFVPVDPWRPTPAGLLVTLLQTVGTPALSLGYVCAIVLLHRRGHLRRFAAVGRTALTNYLLQSIICTLIFYSYGLGLFGRIGPALLLIPTLLIFGAEVWISNWWLSRFDFGPVEALWRWGTYGKRRASTRGPLTVRA